MDNENTNNMTILRLTCTYGINNQGSLKRKRVILVPYLQQTQHSLHHQHTHTTHSTKRLPDGKIRVTLVDNLLQRRRIQIKLHPRLLLEQWKNWRLVKQSSPTSVFSSRSAGMSTSHLARSATDQRHHLEVDEVVAARDELRERRQLCVTTPPLPHDTSPARFLRERHCCRRAHPPRERSTGAAATQSHSLPLRLP